MGSQVRGRSGFESEIGYEGVQDGAQRAREACERAKKGLQSPLESPWGPDPDPGPHHQAQVEAGGVNKESLQDVRVTAEVGASHAPGFVKVRERTLDQLASHPVQPLASLTSDASAIGVHGLLSIDVVPPLASSPVRLRHIRTQPLLLALDQC